MALDGYTIKCMASELEEKLQAGRIEKVYQPHSELLVLNIRTRQGKQRLLLSADPSAPRMHLTCETPPNPPHPPMFCMLLRKHIQNGTVQSVRQQGLDRIVELVIKTQDELGVVTVKYLVCEIMGRHSNIILLDGNRDIVDAIKRVTPEMSSYRQILPGIQYKSPPVQDKLNLLENSLCQIEDMLSQHSETRAGKAVFSSLEGIGRALARELCITSGIDPDRPIGATGLKKLMGVILHYRQILHNREFYPVIYYCGSEMAEFSPVILHSITLPYRPQDNVNCMLDNYFTTKQRMEQVRHMKENLIKMVKSASAKNARKLDAQLMEYGQAENYKDYCLYGELITANLYRLKDKTASVKLENFYHPDLPEVEIQLNPNLSPAENAQRFFKDYSRGKRVMVNLKKHIRKTREETDYLDSLIYNIEKSTEKDELTEIRAELVKGGYIKPSGTKAEQRTSAPSKPLRFISEDNFCIYVGKSNSQNDYLTLKFSAKEDIWLHTKDIPGSHVIIKKAGREIPDTTLYQAAVLAAYYSKARFSSKVQVDYTAVKNVVKPPGAKPGMVIYKNNKTLFITPDREVVDRISQEGENDGQ